MQTNNMTLDMSTESAFGSCFEAIEKKEMQKVLPANVDRFFFSVCFKGRREDTSESITTRSFTLFLSLPLKVLQENATHMTIPSDCVWAAIM